MEQTPSTPSHAANSTPGTPGTDAPPARQGRGGIALLFAIVCVAVIGAVVLGNRQAPLPEYFQAAAADADGSDPGTIEDALARSEASGRPLLVFATAEWCPPCQALKRGPLSDPEIASILQENFELWVLDLTDETDAVAHRTAAMLRVQMFPTMLVIQERTVTARWSGGQGRFETWIRGQRDDLQAAAGPVGDLTAQPDGGPGSGPAGGVGNDAAG